MHPIYPFTAIVGQERMKRALVLNAVSPNIGGVLIRGERGTGKSTAARALAALMPLWLRPGAPNNLVHRMPGTLRSRRNPARRIASYLLHRSARFRNGRPRGGHPGHRESDPER